MENWKDKGFTPIPNILINNPSIPRCARSTYDTLSARCFGKRYSVFVSIGALATDVGVSDRTINRHLRVLEALRLIRRIRVGRGLTNTIILPLKLGMSDGSNLSQAIARESKALSQHVLARDKLTMKEALALSGASRRRKREATPSILTQAQAILRLKSETF